MSTPIPIRITPARENALSETLAMEIDTRLISDLVDTFYEHVRANPDLGPIFEAEIGEQWEPHLKTMKTFWGSIAFHDGVYSGRPMPAHVKLKGLTPDHFATWLALFDRTLIEIDATEDARAFFLERARRIARSFQLHLFDSPFGQALEKPPQA